MGFQKCNINVSGEAIKEAILRWIEATRCSRQFLARTLRFECGMSQTSIVVDSNSWKVKQTDHNHNEDNPVLQLGDEHPRGKRFGCRSATSNGHHSARLAERGLLRDLACTENVLTTSKKMEWEGDSNPSEMGSQHRALNYLIKIYGRCTSVRIPHESTLNERLVKSQ